MYVVGGAPGSVIGGTAAGAGNGKEVKSAKLSSSWAGDPAKKKAIRQILAKIKAIMSPLEQQHWLTDAQFNASIALAQASPGPNLLFVALLGWNVGLNAGGWATGLLGVLLSLMGILVPSTALTYAAAQWGQRNRELRAVRAFKQGARADCRSAVDGHQRHHGQRQRHQPE